MALRLIVLSPLIFDFALIFHASGEGESADER
jgi:hypothetical protein